MPTTLAPSCLQPAGVVDPPIFPRLEGEFVMHKFFKHAWAVFGVIAGVGALAITSAVASPNTGPSVVIWTDASRAGAVTKIADAWAASNSATIQVVTKNFGDIETSLGTIDVANAPDVVVAAHFWTGQLTANGLVEPLSPSKAIAKQFPTSALDAFSSGTSVKRLYGIPFQVENVGLLVNTKLAKVPTTFAQLESEALAAKKKAHLSFGICVQQGSDGDAYHMYPFFSGLGGYIFGINKSGTLNPKDVGIANPTFIRNSKLIDKWNKEGLINSRVDYSVCDSAFTKSQTPFWITGPWAVSDVQKAGITFKVVQVPSIYKPAVPFLGVDGLMVTKFATTHNVDKAAKDLVTNYFSTPSAQTQLAAAGGRVPANLNARPSNAVVAQFGEAGKGGVPMPNIPQMSSVWNDLDQAWVRSTKGSGAMPAARSFKGAARAILYKIG
jgi:arabinogalactan oligomer/maltooligosaccharide transport system substrate-binding protein